PPPPRVLKTILSIVGGVRNPCISSKYFLRPRDGIADSDAGRLWARPEFQVLWPVVVAYPVAVMDRFRWQQIAAENPLHYEYVFEDILPLSGARVVGRPEHDIARLVPGAPSSPGGRSTSLPHSGSWRMWPICLALALRTGTNSSSGMPDNAGAYLKAGTIDRTRCIF